MLFMIFSFLKRREKRGNYFWLVSLLRGCLQRRTLCQRHRSIYRVPTIFIMLNKSPARLFMALRNVLDCSCDETVFTVKMTLLQRTRPFHSRLLMLMQSVAEIQLIILYIILLRKDSVKLKYFSQCWVLQTEKNISASHFKQVRMILWAKIDDTVYVFYPKRYFVSLLHIWNKLFWKFQNYKVDVVPNIDDFKDFQSFFNLWTYCSTKLL